MAERLLNRCRTMNATWLPSRIKIDEFIRSWWFARQLDARLTNLDRVNRILGMEVDVFVRAAMILFAVAMGNTPSGHIRLSALPDGTLERYRVDRESLRLAAVRLSAKPADVEAWIATAATLVPEGFRQHQPSVLVSCPLLNVTPANSAVSNDVFLCPSPVQLMGTVRDRIREAISTEPIDGPATQIRTLYGELLEDYVELVSQSSAQRVLRLDAIEPAQEQHADLLLVDGDQTGLIVEIKRSIGIVTECRGLTRAVDIETILSHFLGAYRQCIATHERRRWEREGLHLSKLAAVVLVDEPLSGEGAVFGELYARQTNVTLPFEIMSVGEYEHALGVLGARGLVQMIRSKFDNGYAGAPLAQFAMHVMRQPTRHVQDARDYLRALAVDAIPELAELDQFYSARWP